MPGGVGSRRELDQLCRRRVIAVVNDRPIPDALNRFIDHEERTKNHSRGTTGRPKRSRISTLYLADSNIR